MKPWLAVIGIGEDGIAGLTAAARALIENAEVLVGGARHLDMVPDRGAERILWERPLARKIDAIETCRGRRVAVLATGDPMWYGVGVTLSRRFPREEMTILPQRSAFSLAASRLGWPLADCATITLHGRPLDGLRLHLAPDPGRGALRSRFAEHVSYQPSAISSQQRPRRNSRPLSVSGRGLILVPPTINISGETPWIVALSCNPPRSPRPQPPL